MKMVFDLGSYPMLYALCPMRYAIFQLRRGEEIKMKIQRVFYLMGLFLGVVILVAPAWTQSKPEAKGPVIRNSYAIDKGQYGTIWKIYIEAEDTDADMTKIAIVVDQVGYGHYPTDFIFLDPQHRKHLKGYLQWNTFSSKGADLKDGDRITLRVSIIDRAGNEIKEIVFPFTFVSGVRDEANLPAPFDQHNLPRIGYIGINLVSPGKGGNP
jgi:hypothetical protein